MNNEEVMIKIAYLFKSKKYTVKEALDILENMKEFILDRCEVYNENDFID